MTNTQPISCCMDRDTPRRRPRASAKTHRDLIAWKVSMELVTEVYRLASQLPAIERYGLASQLRRAGVSIPINVAEGFARRSRRDFSRFLVVANRELQTLIELIALLGYLSPVALESATNLANRTGFLMHRLRKSLPEAP